jgi:hypothetical protein
MVMGKRRKIGEFWERGYGRIGSGVSTTSSLASYPSLSTLYQYEADSVRCLLCLAWNSTIDGDVIEAMRRMDSVR